VTRDNIATTTCAISVQRAKKLCVLKIYPNLRPPYGRRLETKRSKLGWL